MIDIIRKSQMEVTQTAPTIVKYSVAVWQIVFSNIDIDLHQSLPTAGTFISHIKIYLDTINI